MFGFHQTLLFKVLAILCTGIFAARGADQEPKCFSRFDYDHKVMFSIVSLEHSQKELRKELEKMANEVASYKSKIKELEGACTRDIAVLKLELKDMQERTSYTTSGETYIRFGRTVCPGNGTERVYEGYVGGSSYSHTGAAVDYLCLPKDPIYNVFGTSDTGGGEIYGAEYELHGSNTGKYFPRDDLYDHDVPCAVCRTMRSSVIMVPGKNVCHQGWTLEYNGYLTTGHYGHNAASEFVCLDADPEVIPGGSGSKDGKLFYFAESNCGSLRCPPYHSNREMTCAVCSK